jgi:hypothetical protein
MARYALGNAASGTRSDIFQPAIAAAIALRSYLHVSFLSKSHRTVTVRFPDIELEHTWNIDELPWDAFSAPGKKKYYYDLVSALDEDLLEAIQPHIEEVATEGAPLFRLLLSLPLPLFGVAKDESMRIHDALDDTPKSRSGE